MYVHIISILLIVLAGFLIISNQKHVPQKSEIEPVVSTQNISDEIVAQKTNKHFSADGVHYFYVIEHDGPEKLTSLLERVHSITNGQGEAEEGFDIAVVIHGPNLKFFMLENYDRYKNIVDLAAKLDANNVIDFKACQNSSEELGISASSYPSFMELVPDYKTEIFRLVTEGYQEY